MSDLAQIIPGEQVIAGPRATFRRPLVWRGEGTRAVIGRRVLPAHLRDLRPGAVFTLGPWRLRVIAYKWDRDCYVVARDGLRARWWAIWYPVLRPLQWVYCRLILTADLWGLARCEPYTEPTWRDLRLPRWLKRGARRR